MSEHEMHKMDGIKFDPECMTCICNANKINDQSFGVFVKYSPRVNNANLKEFILKRCIKKK